MYSTGRSYKSSYYPSIRDRKLGISEPRSLVAANTSAVCRRASEGVWWGWFWNAYRIRVWNQLLLWRQSLEEKCLKQQANKEDNFPSSSLPQSPPGGRLLIGSNLAKTKSFFLLGLSTAITKLTIIWWNSIWNKFGAYFP